MYSSIVARRARFARAEERLPACAVDLAGAACSCFLREESKDTGHLQFFEGIHSEGAGTYTTSYHFWALDEAGTHGFKRQALTATLFSEDASQVNTACFL